MNAARRTRAAGMYRLRNAGLSSFSISRMASMAGREDSVPEDPIAVAVRRVSPEEAVEESIDATVWEPMISEATIPFQRKALSRKPEMAG